MKRDQQTIHTRHDQMLEMIRDRKEIKVEELAAYFDVSMMTVRRDLQALENQGLIQRFHGGATIPKEPDDDVATGDVDKYREMIARYAASLVEDHTTIFINGSMTSLDVLNFIEGKEVEVITNNANATMLKPDDGIHITLTGGSLVNSKYVLTGDSTIRNLIGQKASIAFIGCAGLSSMGGILFNNVPEMVVNELMISHSKHYYVLCDYTKIGRVTAMAGCYMSPDATIITDEKAPEAVLEQLRSKNIEVIQVKKEDFPEAWFSKK